MSFGFMILAIIGNAVLFLLICITMYLLFRCVKENKVFYILAEAMKKGEKQRRVTEEEYAIMYGNKDRHNFLYKFDLMLEQSGIKSWNKYITTELVGVVIILSAIMVFAVVILLTSSMILSIACVICVIFSIFAIVNILVDMRYKRINQSLIQLFDIMENNCQCNDDIVSIIGSTYAYLSEPLRTCLKRCYDEAILTGDVSAAFRKAELSSPHEKLRDFLRNIEMCSRHTCNYVEIIRDSRNTFKVYLSGKEERRALVYTEMMDIFILLSTCVIFVGILNSYLSIDIMNLLFGTTFGNVMLAYWIVILGYGIYSIIKASRR